MAGIDEDDNCMDSAHFIGALEVLTRYPWKKSAWT